MPYSPGNWDAYAQGLKNFTAGAMALGEGFEDAAKRRDAAQEKAEADTKARAAYKAMMGVLKDAGEISDLDYERMQNADTATMKGSVDGILLKSRLRDAFQQRQSRAAQMEEYSAQADARRQGAMQDAALGEAIQRYSTGPGGQVGPPGLQDYGAGGSQGASPQWQDYGPTGDQAPPSAPQGIQDYGPTGDQAPRSAPPGISQYQPSHQDRVNYAMQTPGLGGAGAVRLMQSLQQFAPEDEQVRVWEDPVTGERLALKGKSVAKTGRNPAKVPADEGAPQLVNLEGIPFVYSKKSGRYEPLAKPTKPVTNKFLQATDGDGKLIPNLFVNPNTGHEIDRRSTLEKAVGEESTTNTPAANTPKEAAKSSTWDSFKKWLK